MDETRQQTMIGLAGKDYIILATDSQLMDHRVLAIKHDYSKFYQLGNNMSMACTGFTGDVIQFAELIQRNMSLYKYKNNYEMTPFEAATFTRSEMARAIRRDPRLVNILLAGIDTKAPIGQPPTPDEVVRVTEEAMKAMVDVPTDEQARVAGEVAGRVLPTMLSHPRKETGTPSVGGNYSSAHRGMGPPFKPGQARLFWIDFYGSMIEVPFGAHGFAGNFCYSLFDQYYYPDMPVDEAVKLMRKCVTVVQRNFGLSAPNFKLQKIDLHGVHMLDDMAIEPNTLVL